jgi:hypothetical protein
MGSPSQIEARKQLARLIGEKNLLREENGIQKL